MIEWMCKNVACQALLSTGEKDAGQPVRCAKCGRVQRVPRPDDNLRWWCQHCDEPLVAPPEGVGLTVGCPRCREKVRIPEASQRLRGERKAAPTPPEATAPPQPEPDTAAPTEPEPAPADSSPEAFYATNYLDKLELRHEPEEEPAAPVPLPDLGHGDAEPAPAAEAPTETAPETPERAGAASFLADLPDQFERVDEALNAPEAEPQAEEPSVIEEPASFSFAEYAVSSGPDPDETQLIELPASPDDFKLEDDSPTPVQDEEFESEEIAATAGRGEEDTLRAEIARDMMGAPEVERPAGRFAFSAVPPARLPMLSALQLAFSRQVAIGLCLQRRRNMAAKVKGLRVVPAEMRELAQFSQRTRDEIERLRATALSRKAEIETQVEIKEQELEALKQQFEAGELTPKAYLAEERRTRHAARRAQREIVTCDVCLEARAAEDLGELIRIVPEIPDIGDSFKSDEAASAWAGPTPGASITLPKGTAGAPAVFIPPPPPPPPGDAGPIRTTPRDAGRGLWLGIGVGATLAMLAALLLPWFEAGPYALTGYGQGTRSILMFVVVGAFLTLSFVPSPLRKWALLPLTAASVAVLMLALFDAMDHAGEAAGGLVAGLKPGFYLFAGGLAGQAAACIALLARPDTR